MKYTEETWAAKYKEVAERRAKFGRGMAEGMTCIIATLEYIKEGMSTDVEAAKTAKKPFNHKESLAELLSSLQGKDAKGKVISNGGFASNASAAMKFAGLAQDLADQVETMKD